MSRDTELLAWAASKVQEQQARSIYGTITFYMERGIIVRSEVKQTEKPDIDKSVKNA